MKDPFDVNTLDFVGGLAPREELIPPVHREPEPKEPVYPESFADYPDTVGQIRSGKSSYAKDWSVRDALLDALRDIDRGKLKAQYMVAFFGNDNDGAVVTGYRVASPNPYVTQGIIMIGAAELIEEGRK